MIDLEQHEGVSVLRLCHGKANVMDVEFCEALSAQFEEHRQSSSVALVLTAQGGIFSAGVDLLRILDGGAAYVERFIPALSSMFEAVLFHPKPVVAAINGHAIAGGCVLACAADHRLMAEGPGHIGVPELLVGVPFPSIALEIMRLAATPQALRSLLFGGDMSLAADALHQGLVHEVVEPASLVPQALERARALAALPPESFLLAKQQILQPVVDRLLAHGGRIDAKVTEQWMAESTLARIRSHVERTFKAPAR